MQMENITKILYSRDINKIKELLTYIVKECKLNNKTDIQLGNFKIDLENLNVMYIDIDGCIEYSKFGLYKKTDKIYDVQTFAITSSLPRQHESVEVRGEIYGIGDLNRAIENTGIKLLEEEIQKAQILSSGIIKNTIKINGGKKQ